ncbi:MAG: hypothetical protein KKF62_06805 [Bacteroidetes bacterium]|nr:hypothetical protein [Bacteroidota bacterium]MBU1114089.1 hypothetical protein [Bacteroidota bacterium]MBU1798863.1 hypothetical protein [Bacteroidota bacterium]
MQEEVIRSSNKLKISSIISKSFIAGIGGYILFLSILLLTKVVSMLIQPVGNVQFETADFILPIIGFFLLFLIRFLENYKES